MSTKYLKYSDLIERWGVDKETVYDGVNKSGWPHLRFGPRTVRFTEEQAAQIEEMVTVRAAAKAATKRRSKEMDERLAKYARKTA